MTHALDDDPAAAATAAAAMPRGFAPPRRSRWGGRLVVAWLVLGVALAVGCLCFLLAGLSHMGWPSFHIVFDGNQVFDGLHVSGIEETAADLLAVSALLAGLLLLVLLPAMLLVALMAGLGLPLLAVGLVLALVLSFVLGPLWLAGLLAWRLAGRGRSPRRPRSARMPA